MIIKHLNLSNKANKEIHPLSILSKAK
uniref:Uncharacterized protein n=1 Tax=Arundo donax TaxID=35708 RepID=A0A0A8YGU6_ARUDO